MRLKLQHDLTEEKSLDVSQVIAEVVLDIESLLKQRYPHLRCSSAIWALIRETQQ